MSKPPHRPKRGKNPSTAIRKREKAVKALLLEAGNGGRPMGEIE
jgi:hypothetical protein